MAIQVAGDGISGRQFRFPNGLKDENHQDTLFRIGAPIHTDQFVKGSITFACKPDDSTPGYELIVFVCYKCDQQKVTALLNPRVAGGAVIIHPGSNWYFDQFGAMYNETKPHLTFFVLKKLCSLSGTEVNGCQVGRQVYPHVYECWSKKLNKPAMLKFGTQNMVLVQEKKTGATPLKRCEGLYLLEDATACRVEGMPTGVTHMAVFLRFPSPTRNSGKRAHKKTRKEIEQRVSYQAEDHMFYKYSDKAFAEGTQATIEFVLDEHNKYCALKRFKKDATFSGMNASEQCAHEVSYLRKIGNCADPRKQYVVTCIAKDLTFFVMPFNNTVDVFDCLVSRGPFTNFQLSRLVFDVCAAMQLIWSLKIVHCDIKPQNILVDGDGFKLADFGCAAETGTEIRRRGSPRYCPPELHGVEFIAPAETVDMWSAGVTFVEVSNGLSP